MNMQQLLATGMLAECKKQESAYKLIIENELSAIHNSSSGLALLLVEDYSAINLSSIKSCIDRAIEAQNNLKETQEKVIKIKHNFHE